MNDRYSGWNGKRLQVEKSESDKREHDAYLRGLRERAAKGDTAAGTEYAQALESAELTDKHQTVWGEAVGLHEKILGSATTKDLVDTLGGARHASIAPRNPDGSVNYGELAKGDGYLASLMYESDLARSMVNALPDWEKRIREDERKKTKKNIRPAVERQVRARLLGDEEPPDTGAGGAPGGSELPKTLAEARAFIARIPAAEYARRETEIDRHLESLQRRRSA